MDTPKSSWRDTAPSLRLVRQDDSGVLKVSGRIWDVIACMVMWWRRAQHLDGVRDVEAGALGVADVQALAGAAGVQQITQLLVVDLQQLHPHAVLRLQPTPL